MLFLPDDLPPQLMHSVTRVGVSPCSPMAEGHGDSAPQGALKVALSGTLDRAGVLVGGSMAFLNQPFKKRWNLAEHLYKLLISEILVGKLLIRVFCFG